MQFWELCTGQSIAATRKRNGNWKFFIVKSFNFFVLLIYIYTSLKSIKVLSPGKFSLFPIGEIARHRLGVCRSSEVGGNKVALWSLTCLHLPSPGPSLQQQGHYWGVQNGIIQVSIHLSISIVFRYTRYRTFFKLSSLVSLISLARILKLVLFKDSVTETTSICRTSSCSRSWRTACPPWPLPSPRTTPQGSTLSPTEATSPTRGSGYSATWYALSLEPTGITP